MIDLIILTASSIIIIVVSRHSMFFPGTYGFYRFFVWEILLISFVLNRRTWFQNPFSWYQCISWIFLIISIVHLVLGIYYLQKFGISEDTFEKTTQLVDKGIYTFIRHPLYSSLLFLVIGIYFKSPSSLDLFLLFFTFLFILATAIADEKVSRKRFGEPYKSYMKRTKRFIPFLF